MLHNFNVHTRINKHRAKREALSDKKLVKTYIYYEKHNLHKFYFHYIFNDYL